MTRIDREKDRLSISPEPGTDSVQILLVVEGTNDIEFLRRISKILHAQLPALPQLGNMEQRGGLIFVPFGGSHVSAWGNRLAPLGKPEFHLYDHELPPEADHRREVAEAVNRREGCRAIVTRKRSLENYLHRQAISAAAEIEVTVDDFCPVAEITAKKLHQRNLGDTPWELMSRRVRARLTHRAKRWLNTVAADKMTFELLQQRDPDGEVISWLQAIARLAEGKR